MHVLRDSVPGSSSSVCRDALAQQEHGPDNQPDDGERECRATGDVADQPHRDECAWAAGEEHPRPPLRDHLASMGARPYMMTPTIMASRSSTSMGNPMPLAQNRRRHPQSWRPTQPRARRNRASPVGWRLFVHVMNREDERQKQHVHEVVDPAVSLIDPVSRGEREQRVQARLDGVEPEWQRVFTRIRQEERGCERRGHHDRRQAADERGQAGPPLSRCDPHGRHCAGRHRWCLSPPLIGVLRVPACPVDVFDDEGMRTSSSTTGRWGDAVSTEHSRCTGQTGAHGAAHRAPESQN